MLYFSTHNIISQPLSSSVVDSVSTGSTNTTSLTISHTTSGAERLMMVGVFCTGEAPALLVKVMTTLIGQVLRPNKTTLTATPIPSEPPTGAYNVVITFSADLLRYAAAGMITLTGVDQANPLGSFAGNNATSNAASLSIPSSASDLVLGVLGCETCTLVTFTATQRWNVSAGSGNEIGAGGGARG